MFQTTTHNDIKTELKSAHVIIEQATINNNNYSKDIERKAKAHVINHDETQYNKFLTAITETKNVLKKEVTVESGLVTIEHGKTSALKKFTEFADSIQKAKAEAKQKLNAKFGDLCKFKEDNGLNNDAIYPENLSRVWVIIILMLVVESGVNSVFFAVANDFGLVGGFLYALILSAINILIAFFTAKTIKYLWHKKPLNVLGGAIGTSILLVLLSIVVLFVGHYRSALEVAPDGATFRARDSMVDNLFGITTFDSWLLIFITLCIFVFVSYKCFKNDDPYPGYGEKDRIHKKELEEYDAKITHAEQLLDEKREEVVADFNREVDVLAEFDYKQSQQLDTIKSIVSGFNGYRRRQTDEFHTFVDDIRKDFLKYCNTMREEPIGLPEDYIALEFTEIETHPDEETLLEIDKNKRLLRDLKENKVPQLRESLLSELNELRRKAL